MPDFEFERAAFSQGAQTIAGVDEVGRGPLAGPVVAAAVILDAQNIPRGLADSKKLTVNKRVLLYDQILASSVVGLAEVSAAEIDRINILQATFQAMRLAVGDLLHKPDFVLVDGNKVPPDLPCSAQAIVKGDDRSLSIAAASIIAKVTRDRLMTKLGQDYPGYGWEKNAGYGTKQHLEALQTLGVTPFHRVSFKPVHNILYQDK